MVSWTGFDTDTAYRVAAACLGGVVVAAVGFAARAVAGARAGVIAAVIAALSPYLWSTDLLVLSETLVALVTAGLLLAAYRYVRAPSPLGAAALGVLVALATLTRAESFLLFPLLALPLAWRGPAARARVQRLAAVTAATALPLLPWVAYNMARFDEPTFISTGAGGALAASSCDAVFYGRNVGWWQNRCIPDVPGDESVRDREMRTHALDYLGEHQSDLPRVVATRIGRVWQVYRPVHTARLDSLEGRGEATGLGAVLVHLAAIPLAIAGGFVLYARRRTVLPFVAIAATVTITAALFYGAVRFRAPADVALVVLAAVALDTIAARVTAARTASIGSALTRNR